MADDLTFWTPTLHAMEAIIDCLPTDVQQRICERLRLLADCLHVELGDAFAPKASDSLVGFPELAARPSRE